MRAPVLDAGTYLLTSEVVATRECHDRRLGFVGGMSWKHPFSCIGTALFVCFCFREQCIPAIGKYVSI